MVHHLWNLWILVQIGLCWFRVYDFPIWYRRIKGCNNVWRFSQSKRLNPSGPLQLALRKWFKLLDHNNNMCINNPYPYSLKHNKTIAAVSVEKPFNGVPSINPLARISFLTFLHINSRSRVFCSFCIENREIWQGGKMVQVQHGK